MKNFAIYLRVSTLDQSYDRQLSDITGFINRSYGTDNINIDVYNEKVSGYKNSNKRPELDKLISLIEKDPTHYKCIYVTEMSRLGRNPLETRILVNDLLFNKKVDICLTSNNGGTYFLNPDGSVNEIQLTVFSLLMDFADIESKTLKSRSQSGKRHNASLGGASGGAFVPYGYDRKNKMLVINEVEAETVKQIFYDYKNGLGLQSIANKLNQLEVPTKAHSMYGDKLIGGKPANQMTWLASQLKDMIQQPLYYGLRVFQKNNAEMKASFEVPALAIISKELFDQCQEIRKNKKGNGRNMLTKNVILLQYLMKCGACGRNFTHVVNKVTKYYACACSVVPPYTDKCGNNSIKINLLDSAIYDVLCKSPALLQYLNDTDAIKKDVTSKIELINANVPVLEKELAKFDNRIDRLMNDYYDDKVPHTIYDRKLSQFKSEKDNIVNQLSNQRKQLLSLTETLEQVNQPNTNTQILKDAKDDRNKLRAIFKQVIHSVTVYKVDLRNTRCDVKLQIAGQPLPDVLTFIVNRQGATKSPPVFKYQTFRIKPFDPHTQVEEDYYNDFYDNEKYKDLKEWKFVTDNQIILE